VELISVAMAQLHRITPGQFRYSRGSQFRKDAFLGRGGRRDRFGRYKPPPRYCGHKRRRAGIYLRAHHTHARRRCRGGTNDVCHPRLFGGQPALRGIGVAATGPLDEGAGRIRNPHTLPTWPDVDIREPLQNAFPVTVILENDTIGAPLANGGRGRAEDLDASRW
jgi:hypothetical protein